VNEVWFADSPEVWPENRRTEMTGLSPEIGGLLKTPL
jgi:hypothetical protein